MCSPSSARRVIAAGRCPAEIIALTEVFALARETG
jgi:hypothetical protein